MSIYFASIPGISCSATNVLTPSLTVSRFDVAGEYLRPTWMTYIRKSRRGTTAPTPRVSPNFVKKGTRLPFRYEIVSSKNYINRCQKIYILQLDLGLPIESGKDIRLSMPFNFVYNILL
jgi:hypothetical protein